MVVVRAKGGTVGREWKGDSEVVAIDAGIHRHDE